MNRLGFLFVIASGFAIGCGTDSPPAEVDTSLLITDLTASEVTQECQYLIFSFPAATATCSDGSTVTVNNQTQSQCEAMFDAVPDGCTATVGAADVCLMSLEADPCNGLDSPACGQLFDPSCT